jgi:predicted transcriptional regulator
MNLPCESIVKLILPAVRAGLIKRLYKERKMSQTEIAERLGITQAAVSKYLSGNYSKTLKDLEKTKEVRDMVDSIFDKVDEWDKDSKNPICQYCGKSQTCDTLMKGE